jgi:hypothetical protein
VYRMCLGFSALFGRSCARVFVALLVSLVGVCSDCGDVPSHVQLLPAAVGQ